MAVIGCVRGKRAQMKIQQMAFMIVALFFFFTLVGLFFLNIAFKDIDRKADSLAKDQAISSLKVVADMPELACGASKEFCLDEDKLRVMSGTRGSTYASFWPAASINVHILEPGVTQIVSCPAANCNHYRIFDSDQSSKQEYATFVSVCKQVKEQNYIAQRCKIGKLSVGVIDNG